MNLENGVPCYQQAGQNEACTQYTQGRKTVAIFFFTLLAIFNL